MLADHGVSVTPILTWFCALHRILDDRTLLRGRFADFPG
jgi:hypothetical protein